METIRRLALAGTELAQAYVGSSRLKLLKVRAVTLHNTRRIRFLRSIGQGAILPRGIKARPRKRHLRIPSSSCLDARTPRRDCACPLPEKSTSQ